MGTDYDPDRRLDERVRMVDTQLAARGISDQHVLDAMMRVPRELFVTEEQAQFAYEDRALPADCAQTISQPYMVGKMTELLRISQDDRVLEVGSGTGYQTAVLARIAHHVYTIEWHEPLMHQAQRRIAKLGLNNVTFRCGDGSRGWEEEAPFDGILVTAGGPDVPPALREQLAEGGRLVIPIGPVADQMLVRVSRTPEGYRTEDILKCRFVKLQGEQGWRD